MFLPLVSFLFAAVAFGDCSADNCLRALKSSEVAGAEAGQTFCELVTSNNVPAPQIPSHVANACQSNEVGSLSFRIASACRCIAAATTSISSAVPNKTLAATITPSATISSSTTITPSATKSLNTPAACAVVSSSWAAQFLTQPAGKDNSRSLNYANVLSTTHHCCSTGPWLLVFSTTRQASSNRTCECYRPLSRVAERFVLWNRVTFILLILFRFRLQEGSPCNLLLPTSWYVCVFGVCQD